jgi:DNA polymerase I-like protein with 3'-5' exonuclease and polymerase domains
VVHDELAFEALQEKAEEAAGIIRDEMEAAGREYLTCVPVIVEVKSEKHVKSNFSRSGLKFPRRLI